MKFKSAEHKRRFEENERSWNELKAKWAAQSKVRSGDKFAPLEYNLSAPPGRFVSTDINSFTSVGGSTSKNDTPRYTGTSMIGIATLHKSNAVPVFAEEDAKDISSMRR